MLTYKAMNPNVALGVATGGAFLLCQVAIALIFKSKVAPVQWAGIAAIVLGMIALTAGIGRLNEVGIALSGRHDEMRFKVRIRNGLIHIRSSVNSVLSVVKTE